MGFGAYQKPHCFVDMIHMPRSRLVSACVMTHIERLLVRYATQLYKAPVASAAGQSGIECDKPNAQVTTRKESIEKVPNGT